MNYLDKTGLTYFWNKIKSALSNKTDKPFVMWTNPSPDENFSAPQTINLSTDDYDMYEVFYRETPTSSTVMSIKGIVGQSVLLMTADGWGNKVSARGVYRVADNKKQLKVEVAYYGGNTTANNKYCIPLWVVGYKTGLNLSIS